MADDSNRAYDLAPEDEPGGGSAETDATAEGLPDDPSAVPPTEGYASDAIPMEPLLDAFDDDEDLESDPEVEEILSGKKAKKDEKKKAAGKADNESDGDEDSRPTLVKDSWDPPKAMFITGGILTLGAIVVTAIYTPDHRVLAPLLALYKIAVHTGTGVVAVIVASMLLQMKTGRLDKAASRVFVAVAAFMLLLNMKLDMGTLSSSVQIVLASFSYLILMAWLFRFRRDRLLVVTIAHLALVVVIKLGMVLSTGMAVTGTNG